MHLEFSQFFLLLRCLGLFPREIQLARGGVPLNLLVPISPITFGNPFTQPNKVFTRQGFNFGLNGFDSGHVHSVRKLPQWEQYFVHSIAEARTGQVSLRGVHRATAKMALGKRMARRS
jgi:hypothetical protein